MRNILIEQQNELHEKGISEQEYQARKKGYLETYFRLREKDENSFWGKLSLKARQRLHPLALAVYTVKNRMSGMSFEFLSRGSYPLKHPIIFAVTHVGKWDIEVVSQAIRKHAYLLSGDFESMQGTINAWFLNVNGVIYLNEKVKSDRRAAVQKMITHLRQGGNLLYFPEGAWNLSPNLPVLPCFWGIVEAAQNSGAMIVPVAAEQYGNHFFINMGQAMDMGEYIENKAAGIQALRDHLAALKWEIWEKQGVHSRSEISETEWDEYVKLHLEEWTFSQKHIDTLVFRPKGVTERSEAYDHLNFLYPKAENAFLLNKRLW